MARPKTVEPPPSSAVLGAGAMGRVSSARLIVLEGPGCGRRYAVGDQALLGRSVTCEVLVDDAAVSRSHAQIRRLDGGGYVVEDLDSANGTFVNGHPIERCELQYGDRIRLASRVLLLFTRHDASDQMRRQRQRLETLGRLAAGVAHDFNNMQSVITTGIDYVRGYGGRKPDAEAVSECLADMMKASERATSLSRALLGYARSEGDGYGLVDVSAVVAEVVRLATRTFARLATVTTEISPGLWVVGSNVEIHQVLMNLCVNACDAMPSGGGLHLVARSVEPQSVDHPELPTGARQVVIEVTDSGVGMDEEVQRRAFEPFFTTKGADSGYGLGLATVKDIVLGHGGSLTLVSEVGRGSTFQICVPEAPSARQRRAPSTPAGPIPSQLPPAFQVLVAADEEMLRKGIGRILAARGCQIVLAADTPEVLAAFQIGRDAPDLVVMDFDMARAEGEKAVSLLREVSPDTPILCIYSQQESEYGGALMMTHARLRKPFTTDTLIASVNAALECSDSIDDEDTVMVS